MDNDADKNLNIPKPAEPLPGGVEEPPIDELDTTADETPSPLSQEAIEKLVTDNMGLAYYFANKWRTIPGVAKEDIESQALHGLVKAANTYNPAKGRFSSYASMVIHNYLGHMNYYKKEQVKNELEILDAPMGGDEGGEGDDTMHDKVGGSDDLAPEVAAKSEAASLIAAEIEVIPEPARSMVKRHLIDGESYRDMQKEFGKSFTYIGLVLKKEIAGIKQRLADKGVVNLKDVWPESMESGDDGRFIYECLVTLIEVELALKDVSKDAKTVLNS